MGADIPVNYTLDPTFLDQGPNIPLTWYNGSQVKPVSINTFHKWGWRYDPQYANETNRVANIFARQPGVEVDARYMMIKGYFSQTITVPKGRVLIKIVYKLNGDDDGWTGQVVVEGQDVNAVAEPLVLETATECLYVFEAGAAGDYRLKFLLNKPFETDATLTIRSVEALGVDPTFGDNQPVIPPVLSPFGTSATPPTSPPTTPPTTPPVIPPTPPTLPAIRLSTPHMMLTFTTSSPDDYLRVVKELLTLGIVLQ